MSGVTQEVGGVTSKIYMVGVGPGGSELITIKACALIRSAQCVAGFRSALNIIGYLIGTQRVMVLDYHNQEAVIKEVLDLSRRGNLCVVCVYGDPNVSDWQLMDRLSVGGVEVEVVPGISSVQAACSRLRLPLERTVLVTFHKRGSIDGEKRELLRYARLGGRHLVVLPRPWDFMPQQVAEFLLKGRLEPERLVTVVQRVTLDGERVSTYTLGELAEKRREKFSDLSIMVIEPRGGANHQEKK